MSNSISAMLEVSERARPTETPTLTTEERTQVSRAMSLLAKVSTPATKAARRENALKAAAANRKDPLDLPCLCEGGGSLKAGDHKTTCPRGRLLWQRKRAEYRRREKPIA